MTLILDYLSFNVKLIVFSIKDDLFTSSLMSGQTGTINANLVKGKHLVKCKKKHNVISEWRNKKCPHIENIWIFILSDLKYLKL